MTDSLPAKPNPRDKFLRSPDRQVRMKEKMRRMPEGVFTFAAHLEGVERKKVQEELVDKYLSLMPPQRTLEMCAEDGVFLVRFTRAHEDLK